MNISKNKIELILAEKCMTLGDLSKLCEVTRQNICTILRRGTCTPKTVGKFAKALGVPVSDIIEEE